MDISMIVAVDNNNGIGIDGDLAVKSKSDMKFFRETTTGGVVVMGRTTYESIGKPLPNRTTLILTRDKDYIPSNIGDADHVFIANSLEDTLDALDYIEEIGECGTGVFVIGGESIYNLFINNVDKLIITVHDTTTNSDKFFPEFDTTVWELTETKELDKCNDFDSVVNIYTKK